MLKKKVGLLTGKKIINQLISKKLDRVTFFKPVKLPGNF